MNETDQSPTTRGAAQPRVDAGIVLILVMGLLLALQIAWVLWSGADPVSAETLEVSSAQDVISTATD